MSRLTTNQRLERFLSPLLPLGLEEDTGSGAGLTVIGHLAVAPPAR